MCEGGNGVIHMGLLNIIRKLRLRQGLAIREIARRTGVSRNTIKKYLNDDTIEPQFATPDRSSKLDPFAEKLAGWLKTNAGKSRKDRQTLKKMHADLVVLGFTGSYNRVAAFARQWRADRQREQRECPTFCVSVIWSMLPERSMDDDDIKRIAGRVVEGLQAA
jgi:transcriptional regulator with XRE-family HTH domain